MTKKSNSFIKIITVLLALLLLGIAAGPASADVQVTGGNTSVPVGSLNKALASDLIITVVTDQDPLIAGGNIILTPPSGITFNFTTEPSVSSNSSAPTIGSVATWTLSSSQIKIPVTVQSDAIGDYITISGISLDISSDLSSGFKNITVSATGNAGTIEINVSKPNVTQAAQINIAAGGNSSAIGTTLNVSAPTIANLIGSGTYINITLPSDSGITFNRSAIPTNNSIGLWITSVTISSNGLILSALAGNNSLAGASVNFSGIYLNATAEPTNNTKFNVTTTAAGTYAASVTTQITATGDIEILKPTVSQGAQINIAAGGNSSAIGTTLNVSAPTIANLIGSGTYINITLPSDSGITFNRSAIPTNNSIGLWITSVTISSNGLILSALAGNNSEAGASVNFSGIYLNATAEPTNNTKFNVTTTAAGTGAASVTTQITATGDIEILKPTVSQGAQINIAAGGNGSAIGTTLNVSAPTIANLIGSGTYINITLSSDSGITFNRSAIPTNNSIGLWITSVTISSNGLILSALAGNNSEAGASVNFSGIYLNATATASSNTSFNVTTTAAGTGAASVTTKITVGGDIDVLNPIVVSQGAQINIAAGGNSSAIGTTLNVSAPTIANLIGSGTYINITLPSDSGITFNRSAIPTNNSIGLWITSVTISSNGLILSALAGNNSEAGASVNFSGIYLNATATASSNTSFNVTTTAAGTGSIPVTTQITATGDIDVLKPEVVGSTTIYQDLDGILGTATTPINISLTVANQIGAGTYINITLPSSTGLTFDSSSTITNNSIGLMITSVTISSNKLSALAGNDSLAGASVNFSGIKLNVTAAATTQNYTVSTTAAGLNAATVTNSTRQFVISPVTANTFSASSGNETTGHTVGTTTTLTWTLTNATSGINFGGQRVNFTTNATGSPLSAGYNGATTYNLTGTDGKVSINFTAPTNTIGNFSVTATINGTSYSNVSTIYVNGSTATKLAIYVDAAKYAPNGNATINVTAQDTYGNNVTSGITVKLASSATDVTINPASTQVLSSGYATFYVEKTTAGSVTLTVTDQSSTNKLIYATATQVFTSDIGSILITSSADTLVANGSVANLTVQLKDVDGNQLNLSGQTITVAAPNSTLGNVTAISASTNTTGAALFNLTSNAIGNTGTVWANASITNQTGVVLRSNVSISLVLGTPANATSTLTSTAGNIAAGSDSTFSALIKDSTGQALESVSVTFAIQSTGGSLNNSTASGTSVIKTTDASGYANVTLTTNTTVGINTVRATSATGTFNKTLSITTVNATASKLIFIGQTPATGVAINSVSTIEVQLQDTYGNNISLSGVIVNFTTSESALGTLSAPNATTGSAGTANVTFTANATSGTTTITAASGVLTSATRSIGITTISAIQLTASQVSIQTNQTVTITAQLLDENGDNLPVANQVITFSTTLGDLVNASANTTATTTAITDSTGKAQIGLNSTVQSTSVFTAGTPTVTAITSGKSASISSVIFVGTLTGIIVSAPVSTDVLTPATITAKFVDANGNVVIQQGATITFATSLGTLSNNSAITINSTTGIATVNLSSSTVGTATVSATGLNKLNTTSLEFYKLSLTVTANPETVTNLTAENVTFTVLSSAGTAVSGVTVTLSGNVSTISNTTDANGSTIISVNGTSAGIITATASKTGYTDGIKTITVENPALTVTASLDNVTVGTAEDVTFTVIPALSNVLVTLSGAGVSMNGTTINGTVTIADVTATTTGTIAVTASLSGYTNGETTITAESAEVLTTVLVSSITPTSRNAQLGTPVTLFMTVINGGTGTATGVSISQASNLTATVSYQQWNGTAFIGSANTPVDIAGNNGRADFVLAINATSAFNSSSMTFNVSGTNAAAAPISGVNTLTISASATPSADVIMISTNLNVSTPVNNGTFFALATMNVGGASATGVSLVVNVPTSITGLAYAVNQTNATTGAIIGPATGLTIAVNAQPTFGVWLTPTQAITFDPTNNRITLKLVDVNGKVIGAQSVAVSTT